MATFPAGREAFVDVITVMTSDTDVSEAFWESIDVLWRHRLWARDDDLRPRGTGEAPMAVLKKEAMRLKGYR